MRKKASILSLLVLIGIFFGTNYEKWFHLAQPVNQQVLGIVAPTPIPTPKIEIPVKLIISSIGVSADIEQVGLDSKNNMDVPKIAEDAGWYNLGVKPGEVGNAVLAGHLDKVDGSPAVFWNLKKLNIGDIIQTQDQAGKLMNFKITDKQSYPYNNFPIQQVFGPTNKKMLNLITCDGSYDSKNSIYTQREVVYSELMP